MPLYLALERRREATLDGIDFVSRHGRVAVDPKGSLLFEAIDKPTPGRPRGAIRSIDRRHCDDVTLGRCGLSGDRNECAACQVLLNEVNRHEAKSKSGAQEGELGPEIGKTPHFG